jgi:translation initiation factor 3 subunit D
MVDFLPKITVNKDGWGPIGEVANVIPHIPYAPFAKTDKLGKAADWTPNSRQYQIRPTVSVSTAFNAFEDEDEEDFALVDTKPQKKFNVRKNYPKMQPKSRQLLNRNKPTQPNWQQPPRTKGGRAKKIQTKYYQSQYTGYSAKQGKKFLPSIEVQQQWGEAVTVIEFITLQNLERVVPPVGETLKSCGCVEKYNDLYDKIVPKQERTLEKTERKKFQVTTGDDPIIQSLASKDAGTVYATDSVLAVLMCTIRSVYSWDVKIRKENGVLFLEKREEGGFGYFSVNENATEPPLDEDPHMQCNAVD